MDVNRIHNTFGNLDMIGFVVKADKQKATRIKSWSYQDSWMFRLLITFFKILGLATFTRCLADQKGKNSQKFFTFQRSQLGIAYNVLLVCLTLSLNCLSYNTTNVNTISMSLDIFQKILGSISVSTILLSYCCREKALVRIGNRLTDIEHKLDCLYRMYPSLQRQRVFRLLMVVCIFNSSAGLCYLLIEFIFFSILPPIYLLTFIAPPFHLGWFMIQYFLLVTILEADFADVNHAIQCLSEVKKADLQLQSLYQTNRLVIDNSTVRKLLELRDVHSHLCDVSQDVSDFYSVSILFAISYTLFSVVFSGYYLILPLLVIKKTPVYEILVNIVRLIVSICPIFLLNGSITKLLDEIARTGKAINNVMSCLVDKEARFELQQISFQLLHRKIYFTASGYFTLDNTLFHSMMSAMTTYLVILAQFIISNGSSSESPCSSTQHDTSNSANNEMTCNKCNNAL